ncbi:MAG: hypothetical protein ACOC1N_02820 [Bacillota bacterium]
MRAWWELYKKEINSLAFFTTVVLLLVFSWELFLFYKASSWPLGLSFGLSFLPFSLFSVLILWLGYNGFRQEWKDDTNYFLLSLPRRGWELTLAKLAAGMTFLLVVTLVTTGLIYLFQKDFINYVLGQTSNIGLEEFAAESNMKVKEFAYESVWKTLLSFWVSSLAVYIITQFSQLISLFFDRFRGFITIVVFIFTNYFIYRGATLLSVLFNWLPDFPVRMVNEVGNAGYINDYTFHLGSGPIAALVVLLIGIFFFGSWVLEHHLEV